MYVSFCGDRNQCERIKYNWNGVGPCGTVFPDLCSRFFEAEGGQACVNQGVLKRRGADYKRGSCEVSGTAAAAAQTPAP